MKDACPVRVKEKDSADGMLWPIPDKVERINNREPPIQDEYIGEYPAEDMNLVAIIDGTTPYAVIDHGP